MDGRPCPLRDNLSMRRSRPLRDADGRVWGSAEAMLLSLFYTRGCALCVPSQTLRRVLHPDGGVDKEAAHGRLVRAVCARAHARKAVGLGTLHGRRLDPRILLYARAAVLALQLLQHKLVVSQLVRASPKLFARTADESPIEERVMAVLFVFFTSHPRAGEVRRCLRDIRAHVLSGTALRAGHLLFCVDRHTPPCVWKAPLRLTTSALLLGQ